METTLNQTIFVGSFMQSRWLVLAIHMITRLGVGLQFVAIAALIPQLKAELGFNFTQLGILLGAFLATGVFLSLPMGLIATRMGDRRTLRIGLCTLVAGGILVSVSDSFSLVLIGRLLGGVGAVATSVVGSKMITDWFIGREIRTALSLFGLTWPAGIGLGMTLLPIIGAWNGWEAAFIATSVIPALALILIGLVPRNVANPHDHNPVRSQAGPMWSLSKREFWVLLTGGAAWPLMNGGGYVLFSSYGPGLLMERGSTAIDASLVIGMLSWLIIVTIPIGGILADRTGRNGLMFLLGCLVSAAAIAMVPFGGPIALWVILAAALGLTVGPVMALPSDILRAESRATGFGLYYTLFYLGMSVLLAVGGWLLDQSGSISVVIWLSAACLLLAPGSYFAARLLLLRGLDHP